MPLLNANRIFLIVSIPNISWRPPKGTFPLRKTVVQGGPLLRAHYARRWVTFARAPTTFCKNSYATLSSVMQSCKEALNEAGVWMTQYPVPVEASGHLGLVTKLTHVASGQWQASLLVLPVPKNDPQGIGSAITYGRRYALSAILGIVTEEDDDGNAGCGHMAAPRQSSTSPASRKATSTAPPVAPPASSSRTSKPSVPPSTPAPPVDVQALIARLPKLDGVTYAPKRKSDGSVIVVASGDTRSRSTVLKTAGFKWEGEHKLWWLPAA